MTAIFILIGLGIVLGLVLGIASRFFQVENNPLVNEIKNILPGANCGQCGYAGCEQYAEAVVEGKTKITLCSPGGNSVITALAKKLGVKETEHHEPLIAVIDETRCAGCTKCSRNCMTDCIVGAPKMIHTVFEDSCGGCGACVKECPFGAIKMKKIVIGLNEWHWDKPSTI